METNYGSNSNALKETNKQEAQSRVTSPVVSNVTVKKPSSTSSLAKKFFANDLKTTATSVTNDVIIPGAKSLIVNILKKAVDYLFTGTYASNDRNGYTNYSVFSSAARNVSYVSSPNQPRQTAPTPNNTKNSIYAIDDVVFETIGDAENVLRSMNDIIGRYGTVSVLDFYELINTRCPWTDNKYGWRDLSTAKVVRGMDGYRIQFPKVQPIE